MSEIKHFDTGSYVEILNTPSHPVGKPALQGIVVGPSDIPGNDIIVDLYPGGGGQHYLLEELKPIEELRKVRWQHEWHT